VTAKHPKYHVRDSLKYCLAMLFFLLWGRNCVGEEIVLNEG